MDQQPSRRGFVAIISGALAAIPAMFGSLVALRAFLTPAKTDQPSRRPLCKLTDVPATGVLVRPVCYQVRRGPAVESVTRRVFVARDPATQTVIAMSANCSHAGCPVVYRSEQPAAPLVCPCHDGAFSITGEVQSGPPNQPLERFQLELPDDPDGTIFLLLEGE